ncbi:MAG: DUF2092 domain-containing protein [Haliea sp.]|jgi:hypothetical protein|nr:DUF2092 domain-containing protein [Haliea sp.]
MYRRFLWLLALVTLDLATGSAFSAEAETRLVDMAVKLADTKQFTVAIHMKYDVLQESGQVIEFGEVRTLQVSRPEYLRVDAQQSDGDSGGLIFDGKTITQFSDTHNVYTQIDRPGDIDGAIRYAVGELGVRFPLARMLVTSFPQEIRRLTTDIDFIERNTLGPVPTDHIAGRTDDLDYQIWIREDNFPTRIVLTYKNAPGQPQFRADFSNWDTVPSLKRGSFTFTPPHKSEKIPTLLPASSAITSNPTKGDAK